MPDAYRSFQLLPLNRNTLNMYRHFLPYSSSWGSQSGGPDVVDYSSRYPEPLAMLCWLELMGIVVEGTHWLSLS